MTYQYSMLPVLVRQWREEPYCISNVRSFVAAVREELKDRRAALLHKQLELSQLPQSRGDRARANVLFETEQKALKSASAALTYLELFLKSKNAAHLGEAMLDFQAGETHYDHLMMALKKMAGPSSQVKLRRPARRAA